MITAHALAIGAILVSNDRVFRRVKGLQWKIGQSRNQIRNHCAAQQKAASFLADGSLLTADSRI
jgi:hypothetical protein